MCAQVYLPVVEVMQHGRVRKRAMDVYGNLPDMSTSVPYLMLVCMKWNWEMEQLLCLQQMSLLSPCMYNVMLRETSILRETASITGCNCEPSCCLDESAVKDADKLLLQGNQ